MPEMLVVTSQGVRHAAGCDVPDHTISNLPLGARASSPHARSVGVQPAYSDTPPGYAGFQPACWERGRPARMPGGAGFQLACRGRGLPARMPGAQALRPHTAIHPITPAPPGCAGVSPACRVRGHRARIQQYTPSPLHRLGARASRPHAGCTGIAPAYSDTPHHPCTAWVRGLPARMPGAQASRPHTAIHPITPAPPGCAGVAPACRVHRHRARIQRYTTWERGLPARIPRQWQWVLDMLSHPDKCLDCGFHKRADSILQQWLKRCQRLADRFAFTLFQITFPLLRL